MSNPFLQSIYIDLLSVGLDDVNLYAPAACSSPTGSWREEEEIKENEEDEGESTGDACGNAGATSATTAEFGREPPGSKHQGGAGLGEGVSASTSSGGDGLVQGHSGYVNAIVSGFEVGQQAEVWPPRWPSGRRDMEYTRSITPQSSVPGRSIQVGGRRSTNSLRSGEYRVDGEQAVRFRPSGRELGDCGSGHTAASQFRDYRAYNIRPIQPGSGGCMQGTRSECRTPRGPGGGFPPRRRPRRVNGAGAPAYRAGTDSPGFVQVSRLGSEVRKFSNPELREPRCAVRVSSSRQRPAEFQAAQRRHAGRGPTGGGDECGCAYILGDDGRVHAVHGSPLTGHNQCEAEPRLGVCVTGKFSLAALCDCRTHAGRGGHGVSCRADARAAGRVNRRAQQFRILFLETAAGGEGHLERRGTPG